MLFLSMLSFINRDHVGDGSPWDVEWRGAESMMQKMEGDAQPKWANRFECNCYTIDSAEMMLPFMSFLLLSSITPEE